MATLRTVLRNGRRYYYAVQTYRLDGSLHRKERYLERAPPTNFQGQPQTLDRERACRGLPLPVREHSSIRRRGWPAGSSSDECPAPGSGVPTSQSPVLPAKELLSCAGKVSRSLEPSAVHTLVLPSLSRRGKALDDSDPGTKPAVRRHSRALERVYQSFHPSGRIRFGLRILWGGAGRGIIASHFRVRSGKPR
jgi:hypothetical protein